MPPTGPTNDSGDRACLCPPCQSTPGGETVQATFQDVSLRGQEAELEGLGLGPLKAPLLIPVPEFGTALRAPECQIPDSCGSTNSFEGRPMIRVETTSG